MELPSWVKGITKPFRRSLPDLNTYKIPIKNPQSQAGKDGLEEFLLHLPIPTHFYDQRYDHIFVSIVPRPVWDEVSSYYSHYPSKRPATIQEVFDALKKKGYQPQPPIPVK